MFIKRGQRNSEEKVEDFDFCDVASQESCSISCLHDHDQDMDFLVVDEIVLELIGCSCCIVVAAHLVLEHGKASSTNGVYNSQGFLSDEVVQLF